MQDKFRVLKSNVEVKSQDFVEGRFYSLDLPWADGNDPEEIGLYGSIEEAREAAKAVKLAEPRYCSNAVPFYEVEEAYIEEVAWDEDSEEWVYVNNWDTYTYFDTLTEIDCEGFKRNGYFEQDGKKYVLLREAHRADTDYFEAPAIIEGSKADEDGWVPYYTITWEVTGDDEDDSRNADWASPYDIEDGGEYNVNNGRFV